MDIIDALSKIKKLEREIEELKKELKKSKYEIKMHKQIEERYLDEYERLSKLVAKYAPFEDYDEVIVKQK
jgi:hypothetical protein